MAYEVLSIGDAEMLYNAFQGTAMIFGNNNLNDLIKAGFTLGLLLISFRYLTNQEFPLRYALAGLILYWVMFIPK
jgi:conjugal transfer mating pair stabilization protein TraG